METTMRCEEQVEKAFLLPVEDGILKMAVIMHTYDIVVRRNGGNVNMTAMMKLIISAALVLPQESFIRVRDSQK